MQYIFIFNLHSFLSSADFACYLSSDDLEPFEHIRITIRESNSWIQLRLDVWPDLGPNCLQR